jgi:hypothetical protein
MQMRCISIIGILLGSFFTASSIQAQEEKVTHCRTVQSDSSSQSYKVLSALYKLNAVSLGDAGESGNPEKYLQRFQKFVDHFDRFYSDKTLIAIIKKNDCPLLTCYAFHALVKTKGNRINDRALEELLLPFAKDSTSYIDLDWGCSSTLTETFDYLLALLTGPSWNLYLAEIKPLSKVSVERILAQRKPYFKDKDIYGEERSWEAYKQSYLR